MSMRRIVALVVAVIVLIGVGVGIGLILAPTPKPKTILVPVCKSDPAAIIAALPPHAIFDGQGNCYTTHGITLTKPVTINGGTYNDPLTTPTGLRPIFQVHDTTGVTIENVNVTGVNPGGYHRHMVAEEGYEILSSSHVSLVNDTTANTYGDGLTMLASQPLDDNPDSDIAVDGLTITNAGRQGVTFGEVWNSIFDHLTMNSASDVGYDFETDILGAGSKNVVIQNSIDQKGVDMQEALHGPLTFKEDTINGDFSIHYYQLGTSGQLISFVDGVLSVPANFFGTPPSGIYMVGGKLTFVDSQITRKSYPKNATGRAWIVIDGGQLTLQHTPVAPPLGSHDPSSTVTVVG